jgi:hypothetical protein
VQSTTIRRPRSVGHAKEEDRDLSLHLGADVVAAEAHSLTERGGLRGGVFLAFG